jgi:hypothetical protein
MASSFFYGYFFLYIGVLGVGFLGGIFFYAMRKVVYPISILVSSALAKR